MSSDIIALYFILSTTWIEIAPYLQVNDFLRALPSAYADYRFFCVNTVISQIIRILNDKKLSGGFQLIVIHYATNNIWLLTFLDLAPSHGLISGMYME